ncbi:hypothetical protein M5689_024708 [Euphorbia peplus]|nr:hypothetical protein M5689_024708 [Euphorbia peplus]
MKLQFVVICFLISIATTVALTDNWIPIKDLKNSNVVEKANFAIKEHNKKANTNFKLGTIEKGESKIFMGMNYRLLLVVREGASKNKYEAIIWVKPGMELTLVSFKPHKL